MNTGWSNIDKDKLLEKKKWVEWIKVFSESVETLDRIDEILEDDNLPTFSWLPKAIVKRWSTYSFKPDFVSPDWDIPTYSIENKPSWAKFNEITWELSWKLNDNDCWRYDNIRISVSTANWETVKLDPFYIIIWYKTVIN